MATLYKYLILIAGLFSSLNTHGQFTIVATSPTDNCSGFVNLEVVNPQPGYQYEWLTNFASCYSQVQFSYGFGTSTTAYGTGGVFCIGTPPVGSTEVSNIIFVRILPGGSGSLNAPAPYNQNPVYCQDSIYLCVPFELVHPSFSNTSVKWYRNNIQISGIPNNQPFYYASLDGYYKYSISNGCFTNFSDSILFVSNTGGPLFLAGSPSPVCNGNTLHLTVQNPVPGALYSWQASQFPTSGFSTVGQGVSIDYLIPSALNLYVRLQRYFPGCQLQYSPTQAFTIQNISRQVYPFSTQNLCPGATINFSVNPSGGVTGIQWMRDGVAIPGATQITYVASQAGIYNANVTATCGVASSNFVTVNAASLPAASISAGGPTTFCAGNSVALNANTGTGLTYQWKKYANIIAGATTPTLNATGAGKYKCIVTNAAGCSKSSNTITVNVNPLPTATITAAGPTTFCAGGSVVLNANTGTGLTYQWKKYANNISGAVNASYTAAAAGKYKCVVTNANGCSKASNAITVNVPCRVGELENSAVIKYKVYPNPSFGNIKIEFENETEGNYEFIKILDLSGKEADCNIKLDKNQILVHNLKSGLYILNIRIGNTISNEKIVVF
ncbi:MAG: T9SS type A sorting domain-containing protein [Bacteroidia bacterium]|nr:T9SS type A sorting domain-containing protein [Bacteroidia bacterium]